MSLPKSRASTWLSSHLSKFNASWLLESNTNDLLNENAAESSSQPSLLEELDIHPTHILHQLYTILLHPFLPMHMLPASLSSTLQKYVTLEDDFWGACCVVALFAIFILHRGWQLVSWVYFIWFLGAFFIWFIVVLLAIPSRMDAYERGKDADTDYTSINIDDLDNFTFDSTELDMELDHRDDVAPSRTSSQFNSAERAHQRQIEQDNKKQISAIGSISFSAVLSIIGYALLPIAIADASLKFFGLFVEIETTGTYIAVFLVRLLTWLHSTYAVAYVLIQVDKAQHSAKDSASGMTVLERKRWMLYWPVGLIFLYFISLH